MSKLKFQMKSKAKMSPKFNKQVQHFRFWGFRIMIADYDKSKQNVLALEILDLFRISK